MKATSFLIVVLAVLAVGRLGAQEPTKAIAVLHPTAGSNVSGTVTFTKGTDGIQVVADLTGLTPGKHGFHVHEFGDCSSADGNSAGGHFNPTHKQHGAPDAADRHAGDLGNIEADASGKAHLEWSDKVMKLSGANSIVGHEMIVHERSMI